MARPSIGWNRSVTNNIRIDRRKQSLRTWTQSRFGSGASGLIKQMDLDGRRELIQVHFLEKLGNYTVLQVAPFN